MVLTSILIGVAFFFGLLALLCASYKDGTRRAAALDGHEHAAAPGGDQCLLCHAPLPHVATLDEAVTEIERRIDSDRRDVAGMAALGLRRVLAQAER